MKKKLKLLLLFLIWLASSWALFVPGFFRVHDYTHAARIVEMTVALQEGHFPVRWTQDFGYGYGMPLFEFYAPLPFYVGALFYWLGLDIILVLKILYGLCTLIVVVGSYKLGDALFDDEKSALLVAAAATLAPYRSVNLFVRGALSEAWAISFIPLILLGLVMFIKRKKTAWIVLTLSTAGLMLSHNLTTMIFLPMSILFYFAVLLIELNQKKLLFKQAVILTFQVALSYLLAIGLSAFYLFPAFLEKGFTKVDQSVISDYFNFNLHFLYIRQFLTPNWGYGGSGWGVDDGISFFFGWGQLIGLIILPFYFIASLFDKKRKVVFSREILSSWFLPISLVVLLLVCLFMSLLKSQLVWQALPLFKYIQFPWRWLSIAIIFLALLQPFSLSVIRNEKIKFLSFLFIFAALLINTIYFRPEKFLSDPSGFYYTDRKKIRTGMSDILQDYIPKQMPKLSQIKPIDQLVLTVDKEPQKYTILIEQGHQKLIATDFTNPTIMSLGIAGFPGWKAEIDGDEVSLNTTEYGNLEIEVPAGSHLLGVIFDSTLLRKSSDFTSALAALIFICSCSPHIFMHAKNKEKQNLK